MSSDGGRVPRQELVDALDRMTVARRQNNRHVGLPRTGIRHVTMGVTQGVTKGVTYAAASPEQLASGRFRFGLELRPPVAERLQRQALRHAILPLIQITALPGFVMRPPERLAIPRPAVPVLRHLNLLSIQNHETEKIGNLPTTPSV